MINLPVLARNLKGLEVVEAGGVAVVTSQNLAKSLGYRKENAVTKIYNRDKESFKDGGVFDLSGRGCQFGSPFSEKFDTALVRLYTPSAADGRGGGIQEVRVFTKRGAMKVCMKSNQPKAVMVQDMLLDLYEQVENGQLMGAERFGRMLEGLAQGLTALQQEVAHLKSRPPVHINLPDDMALTIRRAGHIYKDIVEAIRKRWPDEPERHTSLSSVQRLWANARAAS
jgi:hypothetical protein